MMLRTIILSSLLFLFSTIAIAGLVQPAPVQIDFENRFAQGDMVTARYTDDESTFIGCAVRKIAVDEQLISFGFCQAGVGPDPEDIITCFTQNEGLLDAINAISDYSFITFAWDENDECTRMGNSTQSFYIPNLKVKK